MKLKKKKIDWEERRFWAAALLLSGMSANYNNGIYPSPCRVEDARFLADQLIQALNDPSYHSPCDELYQR